MKKAICFHSSSSSHYYYLFLFFSSICQVNGGWSVWGSWSGCTVTCGGGSQTRTRSCTNPPPAGGGADCQGISSQSQSCNNMVCPGELCIPFKVANIVTKVQF